jgi:pimeloyl-ACP methyl ester carboxylesterase
VIRKQPDGLGLAAYRRTRRMITRSPLMRIAMSVPGTLRFIANNLDRRLAGIQDGQPDPHLTVGLAAHVAADEAVIALAMGPNRFPRRADYIRVGAELRRMRELFAREGWLANPRAYHRDPPPLDHPAITNDWTIGKGPTPVSPMIRFERMLFASEFEPRPTESGYDRWISYKPNYAAGASLVRHREGDRPWLIGIHGFGMGVPFMDFGAFPTRLHTELGYNLVLPTLPLHGHRRVTRMSGEAFLSFDLVNSVHGLTQAIWDIRRIISWIRTQSSAPIAVYGVSLGAYVASLLAAIEPGLDRVLAGIPASDFPTLFRSHSPSHIQLRAVEHGILGGAAEDVHRVVSPLAMPPLVPRDRLFIFAGQGDRVVRPEQARALWEHWHEPSILWYPAGHVGYLMSGEVHDFVDFALDRRRWSSA